MKKVISILVLICVLSGFTTCGQSAPAKTTSPSETAVQNAATPTTELDEVHICSYSCEICKLCFNQSCNDATCAEKCQGHSEEPFLFSGECSITTQQLSIDTGTLVFDIGPNIFVPANVEQTAHLIAVTMEEVSGLCFDGAGYVNTQFPDGKVHVTVSRDMLYNNEDWYSGRKNSEQGAAYASAFEHACVSPGDLFLGYSYAAIHELGHVLMYRQSEWTHSQLLTEGFAEYTTYLVLRQLYENQPETAIYFDSIYQCLVNIALDNDLALYDQPLEYWFENIYEYAGNGNYAVGFRFMAYLHSVYGDYGKWIPAFEEQYSFRSNTTYSDLSATEQQIAVLKATYGDDVLDNFYSWLKENGDRFHARTADPLDLTNTNEIRFYPLFNAVESKIQLQKFNYEDLYVSIDSIRMYLGDYKQLDTSDLKLKLSGKVGVNLYQADGSYTTVLYDSPISLENVSYIKLLGAGTLNSMEIATDFHPLAE